MIVIPDKKLVILLPWKTASQTLRARLGHLDQSVRSEFFHFNGDLGAVVHQHITLGQFLALPEAAQGHRLAVFVRNPYDRVVSGFLQLARDIRLQSGCAFPAEWIRRLVVRQLDGHRGAIERAEGRLDRWFGDVSDDYILCGGGNSSRPLHPCHYWTHAVGRRVADFIGKVEDFEVDFARLCSEFGLQASGSANANVSKTITRLKDENGYDYAARLAPGTIGKINRLFRDDFSLFGYKPL